MTNKKYFQYWGKADVNDIHSYHSVVYHCLDVAAVGVGLAERLLVSQHFAERLGISKAEILKFITFLCAIHDVGKFSDGFQNQLPDLVRMLRGISLTAVYQV